MSGISDLLVIDSMAKANQDVSLSTNLVQVKSCNAGGLITMGVDSEALNKIIEAACGNNEYIICLYVINREQFKLEKQKLLTKP